MICTIANDTARSRITYAATGESMHLLAQHFESLLRLDCTGAVLPGLAREWSTADSVTWHFALTPGATFHDGTPVTARAVAAGWAARDVPFVAQVTALGEYDLRVTLDGPAAARTFADLATFVGRHRNIGLPVGSGPYVLETDSAHRFTRLVRRISAANAPDTIDIRYYRTDLRAAIDAGADVLVTSDPATIAYARAHANYSAEPLPWSRTYIVLTLPDGDTAVPTEDVLNAIARDAVSIDARAASLPYWWTQCPRDSLTREVHAGRRDIVYARGDETARELAERLTALAWPRERAPAWLRERLPADYPAPRAVPVAAGRELMRVRRTALAVVGSVPRLGAPACGDARPDLPMNDIGWHWTITPLIDTREHLIHRAGIGHVVVDGFGVIRFGMQ